MKPCENKLFKCPVLLKPELGGVEDSLPLPTNVHEHISVKTKPMNYKIHVFICL